MVQDQRSDRWSERPWLFDTFSRKHRNFGWKRNFGWRHRNFGCNLCIPRGCVHCAQFDVLLIGANQSCVYGIGTCFSSEESTWSSNVINSTNKIIQPALCINTRYSYLDIYSWNRISTELNFFRSILANPRLIVCQCGARHCV